MKAILVQSKGTVAVKDVPVPEPGLGQIVVKVRSLPSTSTPTRWQRRKEVMESVQRGYMPLRAVRTACCRRPRPISTSFGIDPPLRIDSALLARDTAQ